LGLAQRVLSEPSLQWFCLSEAFEDGEPNLFSLLRWDYRLVDTLFGREDDLRKILAWAESGSKAPRGCLITGEGGAGKTRLAATAAEILRDKGWTAGFLPQQTSQVNFNVGEKGLFLILDYPEEQPERTAAILKELAERRTAPYPLRVMFLSRRSFVEWERETTILQGRFGRQEIATPAALNPQDGASLIAEAARNFAEHARRPLPDLGGARRWLETSPLHRLPLYAMAGAIHAVLSPTEAFGLGGGELLKNLALREIERVGRTSESLGLGRKGLEHLLALGVLADGLSERAATRLAGAGACERSNADFVEALSRSPWWKNGRLMRLRPDALAAAFLDLALFDQGFPCGRDSLTEWIFIALRENAATFGNRLARVLYDLHTLGRVGEGLHPLDQRLVGMLRERPDRAITFADVATGTVPFWAAHFAAHVALIMSERTAEPEAKAVYFNNAGIYLSALGRREEALAATQEAVKIRRTLVGAHPEAFTPDLAISLNNLAIRLSALGRREEALSAAQEAGNLYRALAGARLDALTPDVVRLLTNLAAMLSALGQHEEALAAAQEAADLYRALAAARPEAFTPDLARSLTNLAAMLSALGRREEALAAAQEAAALYRALAEARPETFTPDLAASLHNLAATLSALGRREEALAAAQEAVQIRRALAAARPEAFTPDLAKSLYNLPAKLSALGRHEEALAAVQEAAGLYRALAAAHPETFTPDLASSLNNLAATLSALGRPEELLAAAQEAVQIRRALAAAHPEAFTPDLASSLTNLAIGLSALGRHEEALAAAQEAADLYRALAGARPETFTPDLAASLHNLAAMLTALGRREEALAAVQEAVQIRRALAEARPETFTPDLAKSLNNLAAMLSALSRHEEALAAAREAAGLYRALAGARPAAFTPNLASSLNNLAIVLSELGRWEEALAAAQEAVQIRRALAAVRPEAFTPALAKSLNNLASMLWALSRHEEALAAEQEAAALLTNK
jgi:tetratricopeptide (TPR) repeat protein